MKAHIVTVINSRTSVENRELYRLEIGNGKKDFGKFRHEPSGHIRADCRAKTHVNGGLPKSAPKVKSVGNCEDEETETSQNVPLGTIDLGPFEVLSDHGDEVEDDESTNATTHCHLVRGSRGQRRFAGSFGNLAMNITKTKRIRSLIVGMGSQSSPTLCNKWILGHQNAPKSVPDVKGCFSVNFPAYSVCQKLGVYQRLPRKAPQCDISS